MMLVRQDDTGSGYSTDLLKKMLVHFLVGFHRAVFTPVFYPDETSRR